MYMSEIEARQGPVSVNWAKAMEEFHGREAMLKAHPAVAYVHTNGYVRLKAGDGRAIWHAKVQA